MQIHIGRNNQQLGAFTVPQVLSGLAGGQFLPTDIAWHEGLDDWAPLSSLVALSAEPPAPVVAAQPAAPAKAEFALPKIERPETPPSRMKAWILRVAAFVVLLLIAIPTARFIQDRSIESRSKANVRSIITACRLYAGSNEDRYPPDLLTLITANVMGDERPLHCPMLKDDTQIGYEYYGAGVKTTEAPDKVIIIGKASTPAGERVVGCNDGSVKMVPLPVLPQAK